MSNERITFRDQLIEQEAVNPLSKEKFEMEIKNMIEGKITNQRRMGLIITLCIGVLSIIQFTYLLIAEHTLPTIARAGFGIGILFAIGMIAWAARILKSGVYNLRKDTSAYNAMIWVFIVMMVTVFMMMAPNMPGTKGIQLILSGIVFLIFGAASLVLGKIEQQELNTKEKMLEIQIQLAEIREKL